MVNFRRIIFTITLFGICSSYAQEIDPKRFFLSPSFDTKLPADNFRAFGWTVGAELLLSDEWGIIVEYSSTHYYGVNKEHIFEDADFVFMGPALLFGCHIPVVKDFEMYAALGASYTNAKGTFGTISILFPIDPNRWVVFPAGKVGVRWWLTESLALRGGYAILRPISIGLDYSL